jgi:hypothetical protein
MPTLKLKVLSIILKLILFLQKSVRPNHLTLLTMKEEIATNLHNPKQLERLYRADKPSFRRGFNALYPAFADDPVAVCWYERLNYESGEAAPGTGLELKFVVIASLVAGLLAEVPNFLPVEAEFFYTRNLSFILLLPLALYFAWKHKLHTRKTGLMVAVVLAAAVFINFLPAEERSDTLLLSCLHLPLFLWTVLGYAFVGNWRNAFERRLHFLRYNGDLAVMTALLVIAGVILIGITIGLFYQIGVHGAEEFYTHYVAVFGLAALPLVGTYLTQTNPQLVSSVSPVIARIFGPLVLVTLVVYLGAILYAGKSPYNDREFLLIFNALLIGVMAIIFFSVAENAKRIPHRAEILVLFLLSVVTVLVNGIALSAILFRINEWGLTPNRAAVLGSNLLILVNLLLVTVKLFKVVTRRAELTGVGQSIAAFLPVYSLWTVCVVFLFPLLFGFK